MNLSAKEMRQAELHSAMTTPGVARCLFCPWTYEGLMGEAMERAKAHRRWAHPEAVMSRKRRSRLSRVEPRHMTDPTARAKKSKERQATVAEKFPHGTVQRYTVGCRCDLCRAGWATYHKKRWVA